MSSEKSPPDEIRTTVNKHSATFKKLNEVLKDYRNRIQEMDDFLNNLSGR